MVIVSEVELVLETEPLVALPPVVLSVTLASPVLPDWLLLLVTDTLLSLLTETLVSVLLVTLLIESGPVVPIVPVSPDVFELPDTGLLLVTVSDRF
jgi:hypothetical protein